MGNVKADNPQVLLSIVTWNHESTIRKTLESILSQSYVNFKLVVFDNNSSDSTINIVQSFLDNKHITLIKNKENIGFCGGHNYVIKNYEFDFIFLVNPDIILTDDYINKTIEAFKLDSKIGAVCGLLVQSFEQNPLIDSTGMMLLKSRRFSLINNGKRLNTVNLKPGYVAGLDGALPAFKKEAVYDILISGDFFNTLFFAHKEDWDISWRLILKGWKIYFNKESFAVHPRFFKPNNLKARLSINNKIKFDAFKNQFLLLLINDNKVNFLKDFFVITPRILMTSIYCLLFERRSLKAYKYIFNNRTQILNKRKEVQSKRSISNKEFRKLINWRGSIYE